MPAVDQKLTEPDLDAIHLAKGKHDSRAEGVCVMEAVAWAAGLAHSDAPPCVCPVLRAPLLVMNDSADYVERQELKRYVFRVIGTAGDGYTERRGWMAIDWIVREYTSTWLEIAKLNDAARLLRATAEIASTEGLNTALPLLFEARKQAEAVWSAARAAVRAATVWDAAMAAVRAAAVWDGAMDTVRGAAVVAVRVAAEASLEPTAEALRKSFYEVLDRTVALHA